MAEIDTVETLPSSFRDPSGFIFYRSGSIYRQINSSYRKNYDLLMRSGLYEALSSERLIIPHEEVVLEGPKDNRAYKTIRPAPLAFISYPYEWCFSQLKDAALTTLKIQKRSLDFGMSLRDASAYNIQFMKGRPLLIDTLSFEEYKEGTPWPAYRQFCQHFLAPLALMSYKDSRLGCLFRNYIDGIPLDLASLLLPPRSYFALPILSHIHLHARVQGFFKDRPPAVRNRKINRFDLFALLDNLESAVQRLKWRCKDSAWSVYYEDNNYSPKALQHKKEIVNEFLEKIKPANVWDLGANTGLFSRIAGDKGIFTVSFDSDPACVERNYIKCTEKNEKSILPLLLDLTNPSPRIGWAGEERMSLSERGPADAAMALALIHHLAIGNNLPLRKIAVFFNAICRSLIVEFIPKSDSQAQRLLATREDIFTDYTQEAFEKEFSRYFTIQGSVKIEDSQRILYLMQRSRS